MPPMSAAEYYAAKGVFRMRIALPGKDRRFTYLAALLHEKHEITAVDNSELVITGWPCNEELPENVSIVTCGPKNGPVGAVDLLMDEDYQHDIAWMTAEGAIASAMAASDQAIHGAECMVVGWGRIGKALTRRLVLLGAKVTVLSRRAEVCREISAAGAMCAPAAGAASVISGCKFIFSTPPVMTVDADALKMTDRDAVVIDLASPPYGVDMDAAVKLGIKAWREPGLPGRYCPVNAACSIYAALVRHGVLREVSDNG